jgi:hypothetical protein
MPDFADRPMKYIVFAASGGMEAPVLFPHSFTHSWVAGELRPLKAVSAGFVETDATGQLRCYGHSSSLNLASRGETDTQLVRAHLASGTD